MAVAKLINLRNRYKKFSNADLRSYERHSHAQVLKLISIENADLRS
jgi:hypothetical protein